MMAPMSAIRPLTNPLVSAHQILNFKASKQYSDADCFAQFRFVSALGILLRLPQEVIAQATTILQRFLTAGSQDLRHSYSSEHHCAAAIYLAAKQSASPVSPRSVVNVKTYLTSEAWPRKHGESQARPHEASAKACYVSEGMYERERQQLFICESMILAGIGFDTRVVLPHSLALTYIQVLGASSETLARAVLGALNAALLSPQFLYATHQPNALASAAIYLAAKENGVKLVNQNWWEVFDVDREDLGFLVFSLGSISNFAAAEVKG
jgi:cyclin L